MCQHNRDFIQLHAHLLVRLTNRMKTDIPMFRNEMNHYGGLKNRQLTSRHLFEEKAHQLAET